jgi:hypothetical protein
MFRYSPVLSKVWSLGPMYMRAGCGMGSAVHAALSDKEKTGTLQVQNLTHSLTLAAGLPLLNVSGLLLITGMCTWDQ